MKTVTINLTEEQLDDLQPLIESKYTACELDQIGVLIGQTWTNDNDYGLVTFAFLSQRKMVKLFSSWRIDNWIGKGYLNITDIYGSMIYMPF